MIVGKKAPNFEAEAVIKENLTKISLYELSNKYKLIFFYPLDFTFVCPTELLALQEKINEFKELNVEVLAISIDSVFTHLAWTTTPKEKGGIKGVSYPIISDIKKEIAQSYGILNKDGDVALRAAFILDKENIVQSMLVNNLSIGRNIDEILRIFKALQFIEKNGDVCPANWEPGKKALKPNPESIKEYLKNI